MTTERRRLPWPLRSPARAAAYTVILFVSHSLGVLVTVALFGLALKLTLRDMVVPFALFDACFLILGPGLWWAWEDWPHNYSRRIFFPVMFVYAEAIMVALVLSAIRVGLMSRRAGLFGYLPFLAVSVGLAVAFTGRAFRPMVERIAARAAQRREVSY